MGILHNELVLYEIVYATSLTALVMSDMVPHFSKRFLRFKGLLVSESRILH